MVESHIEAHSVRLHTLPAFRSTTIFTSPQKRQESISTRDEHSQFLNAPGGAGCRLFLSDRRTEAARNASFLAGNESFPAGNGPFHSGNGSLPTGSAAFPAGSKAFAAGNEAFPLGNKALPAGNGIFLVGNAAFPV